MDLRSRSARLPVDRIIDRHMAQHHGLIDYATALRLGATPDMIEARTTSGAWTAPHRGVYRSAAAPSSREQELLAAVLACGPHAVASHCSAAWLWGLLAAPPDIPDVAVPYGRVPTHPGIRKHRSTDLLGTVPSHRRGIIVTAPARTILDVAGDVPPHITNLVIDRAIGAKLITVPALTAVLGQFGGRGRKGAGKLRTALEDRGVSAQGRAPTVLESAMARIIKRLNVAPPIAEYAVADGLYRFDHAWPEIRFAAEPSGWSGHSAYDDWARNIAKLNWAGENDWDVAQFTWDQVINHPDETAAHLLRRISKRTLVISER